MKNPAVIQNPQKKTIEDIFNHFAKIQDELYLTKDDVEKFIELKKINNRFLDKSDFTEMELFKMACYVLQVIDITANENK